MYGEFLLIRKMKQGDDEAFDVFVRKYYQAILTYCNCHCFDEMYAEDLTQETFVRFFTKLPDYHYRGKTLNYLYTIAGNLCKDYGKRRKEIPLEEKSLIEEKGVEEYRTESSMNKILVEQALNQLADELREIVILYYFQELKLKEISEILQIGLPLVKYRLRQAKKQMAKFLENEIDDRSGGEKFEVGR